MTGLFGQRPFTGFGPSRFLPAGLSPATEHAAARRGHLLRSAVRARCPRHPGVYGMVDAHGDLIYVGKAKCLRARLASYFRPKSRDPKAGRIVQATRILLWECLPSEFAALLRELELIHRWRPRFNVQGQPGRYRRTYVCIGRSPAPYLFLTRRPPKELIARFGPVPAGKRAREAVRRLNDWYRLRDCSQAQPMQFTDQGELFPTARAAGCIRYEIGTCLGPCTGSCSRSEYMHQLVGLRAFLDGTDPTPVDMLHRRMMAASAEQQFESAADLRDQWQSLDWLRQQLQRIRVAQQDNSFIYSVGPPGSPLLWYLIRCGQIEATLPEPSTEVERQATARQIQKMFGKKSWSRPPSGLDVDIALLIAAWFRRHPQERERTVMPEIGLRQCLSFSSVSDFDNDAGDVIARIAIES